MSVDWGAVASALDALGEELGLDFAVTNVVDSGDGFGSRGVRVEALDRDDRTLPPRAVVVRPLVARAGHARALSDHNQLLELMRATLDCVSLVDEDPRRWTWRMCRARSRWAA